MSKDEEFVRSVWKTVTESEYDPHEGYTIPQTRVDFGHHHYTEIKAADAWSAAAEFTRERLEQIRKVEEEIAYLTPQRDSMRKRNSCEAIEAQPAWFQAWDILDRILAREQAALAELKRGMKEIIR